MKTLNMLVVSCRFGPRFVDISEVYDRELINVAFDVANRIGLEKDVHEGVFTMLGGPTFETPAELRMLKLCGVDAVGKISFWNFIYILV